ACEGFVLPKQDRPPVRAKHEYLRYLRPAAPRRDRTSLGRAETRQWADLLPQPAQDHGSAVLGDVVPRDGNHGRARPPGIPRRRVVHTTRLVAYGQEYNYLCL